MGFQQKIAEALRKGKISPEIAETALDFYPSYVEAAKSNGYAVENIEPLLTQYIAFVFDQLAHPYTFQIYHQRILAPFDYYRFGLDFIRPLINLTKSRIDGLEHISTMEKSIKKGENVILLSNHQVEPDPQAVNILLEKTHPDFAANMIFVAGHRVTTDPLAVPFSKGVNLLCIYSKHYIEIPPEKKLEKLTHNRHAMQKMVELLQEGGKCIYVAPSGGRDRPNASGKIQVAEFDADSIEMFRLMSQRAGKPVHFHTLTLATHDLQPPPDTIKIKLGEKRRVKATPIFLAFGPEIDMDNCVDKNLEKHEKRQARAAYIWKRVADDYARICYFSRL